MYTRFIIILICSAVIAGCGIFGTFYKPNWPWMDTPRKIGVAILCVAGAIELFVIITGHP